MTRAAYTDHLLDILSYDSMINLLSIAERYWLHREIISNYGDVHRTAFVSETPLGRILNISNRLKHKKWTRPELRYNSFRELEENDDETWKPFELSNYI